MPASLVEERFRLPQLDVLNWRFECLEGAGYPVGVAIEIAERGDIDLHHACDLLLKGATVEQAVHILL